VAAREVVPAVALGHDGPAGRVSGTSEIGPKAVTFPGG